MHLDLSLYFVGLWEKRAVIIFQIVADVHKPEVIKRK